MNETVKNSGIPMVIPRPTGFAASPTQEVLSKERWHAEEARLQCVYAARNKKSELYSWFNPGHLFMIQERERQVLRSLRARGAGSLPMTKILDVGCGNGYWLHEFIKWGARPENIVGVDLLPERIQAARRRCPETVQFHCGNAARLNFPDSSFDLVIQSTVFTSILNCDLRHQIANEMIRVVKPGGAILWYDFHVRNRRNSDVQPVKKEEIYRLFQGCRIHLRRITLAPPVTRFFAPHSLFACYVLSKIPWLCSHYFGLIEKPILE
jgi:ubiquinone/menaquinone biosynthesis C-methylase UbiE